MGAFLGGIVFVLALIGGGIALVLWAFYAIVKKAVRNGMKEVVEEYKKKEKKEEVKNRIEE